MSFPRYPKYKASGVDWLGDVPEHWQTSRLKNLFTLMKRPPQDEDEIVTAFRDGEVTLRSNRRIDGFTNAIHEHGYQRILIGDLVIHAMDAFAGAIGVSDSTGKSTPVYSVCEPKTPSVISHYYGKLMRHMALSGYVNSLSKGIRERSTEFRWNEASNVLLVVPPISEQKAIVSFLDRETAKIDGLVEEQRRLMELLKEKRQAVISHAVTQGLNPHAPRKPSGIEWLGDVPEHWEVTRIKHVTCSIEQGWSPQCEGFPVETESDWGVLKVGCVNGGTFTPSENKVLPPELEPIEALGIVKGDLLISRANSRELVGSAAVPDRDYPNLMLCDKLYRLRFASDRCTSRFVCFYLSSSVVRGQIELGATGASASMVNIPQSTILELIFAVPPITEQREIVIALDREIDRLNTLTAEAQRAIDLLQERRTALISAAVTGQIDVRQFATREAV
jgi:type I restriction enzyme S subunit